VRPFLLAVASALAFVAGTSPAATAAHRPAVASPTAEGEERPSVLLVLTDDQRWDTLDAMPAVQRLLVDPGVTFRNAYVVNPLCCPSRASILTGRYSHSTNVYRQRPPYGRFDWFDDRSTVATWLHDAGYRTGMFGKYLDGYQTSALTGHVPPGWDRWVAFVRAGYLDYGLTIDGRVRRHGEGAEDYSTDVLAAETERFVRETPGPLFVVFAPAAPHAPATPADRHREAFADLEPWRPPSFDEPDVSDKPAWLRGLPRLSPQEVSSIDRLRADQHRSLLAVDDAVERLVAALEDTGRLSDALVLLTSDNGLAWGEHRWSRKEVPYEESIRVPLVVRFDPAVDGPKEEDRIALNIDLAPTVAEVARVAAPGAEGRSLLPLLGGADPGAPWRSDFLVEHLEGTNPIPTYCAVHGEREVYVRYATGEEELYDLRDDPFQERNRAGSPGSGPELDRLRARLAELCDPPPPGLALDGGIRGRAAAVAGGLAGLLVMGGLVLAWLSRPRDRRPPRPGRTIHRVRRPRRPGGAGRPR
jgi:arylsulfatase A-like enzyme